VPHQLALAGKHDERSDVHAEHAELQTGRRRQVRLVRRVFFARIVVQRREVPEPRGEHAELKTTDFATETGTVRV